ncbi:putative Bet3 transport protein [Cardiosporidium cionae]|uniref:Trafficking protein particle complex subunit n=1 Tax=Cardiosporidium cionae TaxID=476202 RepID=A0ABQ7J6D8_9APIC|nr:putative Bet3 transport protein [Cardiosporidium cionae]|eukprot:KAF8819556.1 putative Bet3 transport protein [Cardiosporidium cionae]
MSINSELLSFTYGSFVTQLIKDIGDIETVNSQLEQIGHNIGTRIVDEFLAKSGVQGCNDFKETANVLAKVAFKMFLGVTADVTKWNSTGTCCSIVMLENPLTHFVDLPASLDSLKYSNILCGAICGALLQLYKLLIRSLRMKVSCEILEDMLNGGECYEFRLELKELIKDVFVDDEGD